MKLKEIAKYTVNSLAIINALLIGLDPIWDLNAGKYIESITVIVGVISVYLLGQKVVKR